MGNCQAAEATKVVIQHPGGKLESFYYSITASDAMASNPGHYVAVIIARVPASSTTGASVKHLELLRPDDTMHIGHVYRLVSFEEVLNEFGSKKHVKLSRLLTPEEKKAIATTKRGLASLGCRRIHADDPHSRTNMEPKQEAASPEVELQRSLSRGLSARNGQWRPALQSIQEVGS